MKRLKRRIENLVFRFSMERNQGAWTKHTYTLDYESGAYRQNELTRVLVDAVPNFALTPNEIAEYAQDEDFGEMRRRAWERISKARKDKKGDYGEMLLFLILTVFFPTTRFVTKVRLRSSSKEQIKGFDCAHFTIEDETPWLWLGEVKFHENFSSALSSAITEVEQHCKRDYLADEIAILGANIEINKDAPGFTILDDILNGGVSIDRLRFRIPILITYDSEVVARNSSHTCQTFADEMSSEFIRRFDSIDKKNLLLGANFEVIFILIPFHSVKELKSQLELAESVNR